MSASLDTLSLGLYSVARPETSERQMTMQLGVFVSVFVSVFTHSLVFL